MNLVNPQTLVALTVLAIISISASVKPIKSAECNQTCGTAARGNTNRVPYPFGFSPGCRISLNCTGTGQIKIGTFQVQNITSDSILIDCGFKSDNVSCYSGTDAGSGFISYDSLNRSGCGEVYSSVAEVDVGGDHDDGWRNPKVSLQFQAAELGWWLDGRCNCSEEAECTIFTVPSGGSGYRCQCREGFVGDGFAGGGGCQKGIIWEASRVTLTHIA